MTNKKRSKIIPKITQRWHQWRRRFLYHPLVLGVLGSLIRGYIYCLHRWGRVRVGPLEHRNDLFQLSRPRLVLFWHDKMLGCPLVMRPQDHAYMLISQKLAGRIISAAVSKLGIQTISGSTNKGGRAAFHRMVETLKQNKTVGITPDGPRGPRHHLSDGTLRLIAATKAVVFPVAAAFRYQIRMPTWDKFELPLPWSPGVVWIGDPIDAATIASADLAQVILDAMHQAQDRANLVLQERA